MESQKHTMYLVCGILAVVLAIGLIIAYVVSNREKYSLSHSTIGHAYINEDALVLPPNPPSVNWFEPQSYTRHINQSGMDIPVSTYKGPEIGTGAGAIGVGYTDERAWKTS